MDVTHSTEYHVRDIATRSVTLFPYRAQVTREIKNITLRPGANEITISGLSPTVDENSIKVEGTGAAIITNISVESRTNRELFEDVYPESDDDEDESSDDDGDLDDDLDKAFDDPDLKASGDKLVQLEDQSQLAEDSVRSAEKRLEILDAYGKKLDRKRGILIEDSLETYKQERKKAFEDKVAGAVRQRETALAVYKARKEYGIHLRIANKKHAKASKELDRKKKRRQKERSKKSKRDSETKNERQRIRQEREKFWPKYCYSVCISLEANNLTPATSRRASISSIVDVAETPLSKTVEAGDMPTCDLVLSYVTTSAYWSPSYDLQMSTTNATAVLCFDTLINNSTSETWENCKVTLSTSQATFSGIEESIPKLVPWHLRLSADRNGSTESEILKSQEERDERTKWISHQTSVTLPKPRASMFTMPGQTEHFFDANAIASGASSNPALQDYQMQLMLLEQQNKKRLLMARQEQDHIAESNQQAAQQQQQQQQPPPPPPPPRNHSSPGAQGEASGDALEDFDFDSFLSPDEPGLEYQKSLIEETGLTTTYDLPSLKTVVPRTTASKQRVARINFSQLNFSHTIVAKYQPVAYLKAKLRNTSKLTLLQGQAGLTLDGSFMGRTTIPRCSSGDAFSLSLGVDPAVRVTYPQPDVRRTTTGLFTKEDSSVYVRTLMVHNTRVSAGKPVSLLVLDQIPVSEDERLRVELLSPRGLTQGGPSVEAGAPGGESKADKDWGEATANLKKDGQVIWSVTLKAGKCVKLPLEYSVAMPSGEIAKQC